MPMDFHRKTPAQKQWATINVQEHGPGKTDRERAILRYRNELALLTPFAERNAQELGVHVQYVTYRLALERLIAALEGDTQPATTRRRMFKRSR